MNKPAQLPVLSVANNFISHYFTVSAQSDGIGRSQYSRVSRCAKSYRLSEIPNTDTLSLIHLNVASVLYSELKMPDNNTLNIR